MLKDKQKHIIKDTVSIKISFMHYMKWIRVMLPVVFEVLHFFAIFSFSLSLSIGKRSALAKIWRGGGGAPAPAVSRGLFFFGVSRVWKMSKWVFNITFSNLLITLKTTIVADAFVNVFATLTILFNSIHCDPLTSNWD